MSIVVLKLPNVKRKTEVRPKKCPYCEGYPGEECEGLSLSLLSLQKNLSILSEWEYESGSDREATLVCSAAVDLGLEPSCQQPDLEWLEGEG
jgi:hypothetical protein